MTNEKELIVIIQEAGIQNPQAEFILSSFKSSFEEAQQLIEESKDIVVTSEDQVELMSRAKENRLKLRSIRTGADKIREKLKEDALKYGGAVQSVFNFLKNVVEPIEKNLEAQEKFAENKKKEKEAKQYEERVKKIVDLGGDITMYNLKEISEEIFDKIIVNLQKEKDEAEKKAIEEEEEKKRIAKEKELEDERIRKENEDLKEQKEKDRIEREKEQLEQKKKDEADKKERERLQKIIDDKAAEDLKKKEEEEKKKKEEEELERQKQLAPEKEKLFAWSEQIKSIEVPEGLSKAGLQIVKEAEFKLLAISQDIKIKIKNL